MLCVAASVIVAAVACTPGTEEIEPSPTGTGSNITIPPRPAKNAAEVDLLPTDVYELPEFDVARFEGLLDQLRGEGVPAVVNLWASWCAPCRKEGPLLTSAAFDYGDRVQFIGIDICDAPGLARPFIRDMGWPYPSVFAPGGSPCPPGEFLTNYGYLGPPVTMFFGSDGSLVSEYVGEIPSVSFLRDRIRELL